MPFLAIKNFARFQHYRDRNPPWIKLYGDILTDAAFLQMPEAAQAQLMKLWVLASQFGHPLPNKPRLLAGRIGVTGRFYLPLLIKAGFIVATDENTASTDASNALAKTEQNDTPSVRARARSRQSSEKREERRETTKEKATTPAGRKKPRPRGVSRARASESWLGPAARTWEAVFGEGSVNFGKFARVLKPLAAKQSPTTIAEHLTRYLGRTDKQYVSIARFVETFAQWGPTDPNALIDEWGVLTEKGERETRPPGLKVVA